MAARFFQRFRHIVTPMIFPILIIGFLFDTVFTLSDLSVVYLLTQGGPGNATQILPVLAYQIGIQAGSLGRGAAIALLLVPLLVPRALPDAPEPEAEGLVRTAADARTHRQKEIRRHLLLYAGMTPFLFIAVFPIYWMVITAFKQEPDLYRMDNIPFWFNLPPTLKNFKTLFYQTNYGSLDRQHHDDLRVGGADHPADRRAGRVTPWRGSSCPAPRTSGSGSS